MPEIKRLSQELIGKIAAGEVVERPASVVKELVENSIDAGASNVTVELRGGGIEYIRISDNGKGIPAEQIRMAFERHATSKLQTSEQLFDIHTLGFRGEALASIAAVAKVSCTTKTAGAAFGTRCTVEGGEFTDIRQAASPVGTTFIVEDLFFNTPVRRKFLKKPVMEASLVSDYMLRLILSHPEIAFRFVSQGKTIYHSMGDGKIDSALFSLYGKDAFKLMVPVSGNMNGVLLEGYVGVGELSRGNRQQQSFFVNGRYFRSGVMSRAVENGCEGRVMIGKFPMCALFLQLPYQTVDVNVHPNKLEVRFQNESAVAEAVATLVSEALHRETLRDSLVGAGESAAYAPAARPEPSGGSFIVTEVGDGQTIDGAAAASAPLQGEPVMRAPATDLPPADAPAGQQPIEPPPAPHEAEAQAVPVLPPPITLPPAARPSSVLRETVMPAASADLLLKRYQAEEQTKRQTAQPASEAKPQPIPVEEPAQTNLLTERQQTVKPRLIGVVFDTYWIFEAGERLLLVDQHAAHERILYDQMMKRTVSGQLSQRLLAPQLIQLTQHDMALTEELSEVLADAGFEVERFDDSNVAIHAIPTLFGHNEPPKELFLEALDEWQAGRGQVTRERMRRQVAQMACKRAIKGGDKLAETEMDGFLVQMLESQVMPTCPHGRPIVTEITRYELEKKFKRIQ